VALSLPPCDVFCGLSGSGLRAGLLSQSRGAKYVCDRGSAHICAQDRILREEYDRQGLHFSGIDPRAMSREEAEYDAADIITIPSTFAFNTFVEAGIAPKKLRLASYGVDLSTFYPCTHKSDQIFQVLFVGAISIRKGICYLLNAFKRLECASKQLILVGSISREMENMIAQISNDPQIRITGHIDQLQLKVIMSSSQVMVLPSVQEGFGLVIAQAMACGCPVIASQHTGACDLFTDGQEGFIVPIRDGDAIADRLQTLADDIDLRCRMSHAALRRMQTINGWDEYGETMYRIFTEASKTLRSQ
jgi:starch synthase